MGTYKGFFIAQKEVIHMTKTEVGSSWYVFNTVTGDELADISDGSMVLNGGGIYTLIPLESGSIDVIEINALEKETVVFVHSKPGADPLAELTEGAMHLGETVGSNESGKTIEVTLSESAWMEFNNEGSMGFVKIEHSE
jgi:hypothetical protein